MTVATSKADDAVAVTFGRLSFLSECSFRDLFVGPQDRDVGAMSAFLVAIGGKADMTFVRF
jgi:hypothetical protein